MDTSIQEKLRALIFKYTYREHITLETSINKDLCIEGDDAIDFLNEFVILFQVDITHFPFDEYFYNEGELSMIWFLKRFIVYFSMYFRMFCVHSVSLSERFRLYNVLFTLSTHFRNIF